MKEEQIRFLSLLGQLPARLTAERAGWVLNGQPHDIPALVNARLLKPLGSPSQNSTKYFATLDVLGNDKRPPLARQSHKYDLSIGKSRI